MGELHSIWGIQNRHSEVTDHISKGSVHINQFQFIGSVDLIAMIFLNVLVKVQVWM